MVICTRPVIFVVGKYSVQQNSSFIERTNLSNKGLKIRKFFENRDLFVIKRLAIIFGHCGSRTLYFYPLLTTPYFTKFLVIKLKSALEFAQYLAMFTNALSLFVQTINCQKPGAAVCLSPRLAVCESTQAALSCDPLFNLSTADQEKALASAQSRVRLQGTDLRPF